MGGRVRNLAILTALAPHFELEILTLIHDPGRLRDPGPVAALGRWQPVVAWHRRGPAHRLLGQLAYRIAGHGWGREAWFLASRSLTRAVSASLRDRPPAIVHSAYWYTLRHLSPRPKPPVWVIDTHDVQFERFGGLGQKVSRAERRAEIEELRRADLLVAITPKDAESFRAALGAEGAAMESNVAAKGLRSPAESAVAPRIETIGMGLDTSHWSRAAVGSPSRRKSILYYGNMAATGNRAAAIHLCTEILPLLRERDPAIEVVVLGADPAPDVRRLAEIPGVRVTGTVEDPRTELASCGVLALSLRAGSGLRSRMCEVMALETPVVAYAEAVEGMAFEEGRHFLAARSPQEFADQVARLLAEPDLAAGFARAARERVERLYSIEATYGRFVPLYQEIVSRGITPQ
jgi:glycosyltransferase involved in cell wall biosynthesis